MKVNVHKKSWCAKGVRTSIHTSHTYEGHTLTGTNWMVAETVVVDKPGDASQNGRLIVIDRTPDEAEEQGRRLIAWAAEARKRQQGL